MIHDIQLLVETKVSDDGASIRAPKTNPDYIAFSWFIRNGWFSHLSFNFDFLSDSSLFLLFSLSFCFKNFGFLCLLKHFLVSLVLLGDLSPLKLTLIQIDFFLLFFLIKVTIHSVDKISIFYQNIPIPFEQISTLVRPQIQ